MISCESKLCNHKNLYIVQKTSQTYESHNSVYEYSALNRWLHVAFKINSSIKVPEFNQSHVGASTQHRFVSEDQISNI